jgi:DNA polymerase-3 subunit delta'
VSLPALRGHESERRALARAARTGQLAGTILIHGPEGIGKQRFALWLAQLLVCKSPTDEPCGRCQPCHMATRLEHPDIHWFFPLSRPRVSGGADRLGDALEDARAAQLAARRENPLTPLDAGETMGIYLAHVQVLRRIASARPAMGNRKVFVVGNAEALVPQEASQEAANALLKLLEEPPADTSVLLTASDPESLLPTIRSRLLPVRLRPMDSESVERFLREEAGAEAPEAARAARLARGSIGRALAFLPVDGQPGPLEQYRSAARELLEAALAPGATQRLAAAHGQAPAGARGGYVIVLGFLGDWLRDLAATAVGADDAILNTDAGDWLRALAASHPASGADIPAAIRAVDTAAASTQLNLNPQLATASLLRQLAAILGSERTSRPAAR